MPLLVRLLFEEEWLFSIGPVRNDGLGAAVLDPWRKSALIGLAADELTGRLDAAAGVLSLGRSVAIVAELHQ